MFGRVSKITNDEKIENCENANCDADVIVGDISGYEDDTCTCIYIWHLHTDNSNPCVYMYILWCSENAYIRGLRSCVYNLGFESILLSRTYAVAPATTKCRREHLKNVINYLRYIWHESRGDWIVCNVNGCVHTCLLGKINVLSL